MSEFNNSHSQKKIVPKRHSLIRGNSSFDLTEKAYAALDDGILECHIGVTLTDLPSLTQFHSFLHPLYHLSCVGETLKRRPTRTEAEVLSREAAAEYVIMTLACS